MVAEFQTRCPYGKKTKLYKKAKLEKLAEYLLNDGLISRLSISSDYECKNFLIDKILVLICLYVMIIIMLELQLL